MTAVVEHAYQELHTRGSFDPEVMSVVYLINAIGKPNGFQASLLAWDCHVQPPPAAARPAGTGISGSERRTHHDAHPRRGQ